jgi:hypothetical protein
MMHLSTLLHFNCERIEIGVELSEPTVHFSAIRVLAFSGNAIFFFISSSLFNNSTSHFVLSPLFLSSLLPLYCLISSQRMASVFDQYYNAWVVSPDRPLDPDIPPGF